MLPRGIRGNGANAWLTDRIPIGVQDEMPSAVVVKRWRQLRLFHLLFAVRCRRAGYGYCAYGLGVAPRPAAVFHPDPVRRRLTDIDSVGGILIIFICLAAYRAQRCASDAARFEVVRLR